MDKEEKERFLIRTAAGALSLLAETDVAARIDGALSRRQNKLILELEEKVDKLTAENNALIRIYR